MNQKLAKIAKTLVEIEKGTLEEDGVIKKLMTKFKISSDEAVDILENLDF